MWPMIKFDFHVEILENLYSPPWSDSFPILKIFLDEVSDDSNKSIFCFGFFFSILCNEMCQLLEIHITQWNNIFQMPKTWVYKTIPE